MQADQGLVDAHSSALLKPQSQVHAANWTLTATSSSPHCEKSHVKDENWLTEEREQGPAPQLHHHLTVKEANLKGELATAQASSSPHGERSYRKNGNRGHRLSFLITSR